MTLTAPSVTRDSDAWHTWRREGLGASDIAAICGLSPWASPFSLYMEKRGEIPEEDQSDNPTVEFGKRIEPIIPPWFHDRTGLHLIGEQTWCTWPDNPMHRCTLDAFVAESPDSAIDSVLGVGEIKATGDSEGDWSTIPNKYAIQGMWQLHVTNLEHLWFPVLHRHNGAFRIYEMDRDDTIIADLVRLADEFWQRVQEGDPPPIDGHRATSRALSDAYPQHEDNHTEMPVGLVDRWVIARSRQAAVKAELDAIENQIKAALGDAAYGDVGGVQALSFKTHQRRGIDQGAFREAHPEIAERFATESTYRVLRPTKEKK